MANIKSNEKSHRQDLKTNLNNREQKSAMRTAVKKARKDATSHDDLKLANKKLDTVARKGIIHKNKANRTKSRLAKAVNKQAQASK